MPFAPLRPLDAFPHRTDSGESVVALRDPLGVVETVLVVRPEAYLVATLFDGERESVAVAAEVARQAGLALNAEIVDRVGALFSERALLQDARFADAWRAARERFAALTTRPASLAGSNYPDEADALRRLLDSILGDAAPHATEPRAIVGLIAPHIDLERGAPTYAQAYGALRSAGQFDRIIVLGTSHGPTRSLLVPTEKSFETPIGLLATDRDAVARARKALSSDPSVDEMAHRSEHSIELQAIFLKHLQPRARIVPLLCGSLRSCVEDGADPSATAEVEEAVAAVRAAIHAGDGARTLVLAAADLAHVGPRFGGPKLSVELLEATERGDRKSLALAAAGDAAGWAREVTAGGDPRNVCGLSPIYLLLRALEGRRGELLGYRRCESEDQCVTVGAMVFAAARP